jgi:hypothetical protein
MSILVTEKKKIICRCIAETFHTETTISPVGNMG